MVFCLRTRVETPVNISAVGSEKVRHSIALSNNTLQIHKWFHYTSVNVMIGKCLLVKKIFAMVDNCSLYTDSWETLSVACKLDSG